MILWTVLCVVAAFNKRRLFHAFFAVLFLIFNLAFVGMTLITAQDALGARLIQSK